MSRAGRIFLAVIDTRDKEKFRLFKLGNRSEYTNNKTMHVWGVHPDSILEWSKIVVGDFVCFGDEDSGFIRYGALNRKIKSVVLARKLWPKDPRSFLLENMLFFSELKVLKIGFHETLRHGGLSNKRIFPGLYEIAKDQRNLFSKFCGLEEIKLSAEQISIPLDYDSRPEKEEQQALRFIRDTMKSRLLKKMYFDKCQICNYRIEISKGVFYSEVHHIYPLGSGGSDNFSNMIVLCPTHHAEFDFGTIYIGEDVKTIINKNGQSIGKLTLKKNHKLDKLNILFQLYGYL